MKKTFWKITIGRKTLYLLTQTKFKSMGKEIAKHFIIEKILKIKCLKKYFGKLQNKKERTDTTAIDIDYIDLTKRKSIRDRK